MSDGKEEKVNDAVAAIRKLDERWYTAHNKMIDEYEAIVAQLRAELTEAKAEVEALKKLDVVMALNSVLDKKNETIATQARVIEKLMEQRDAFIKANTDQRWERGHDRNPDDTIKETIEACGLELAAITKFEKQGAKDEF